LTVFVVFVVFAVYVRSENVIFGER
jgi:hypothetical protein